MSSNFELTPSISACFSRISGLKGRTPLCKEINERLRETAVLSQREEDTRVHQVPWALPVNHVLIPLILAGALRHSIPLTDEKTKV